MLRGPQLSPGGLGGIESAADALAVRSAPTAASPSMTTIPREKEQARFISYSSAAFVGETGTREARTMERSTPDAIARKPSL